MTKILLVDDHHIVRAGIQMLLESDKDLVVVGEVGSAEEALASLENNGPADLVPTDLYMDGIQLIKALKNRYTDMKIAVLSMADELNKVVEILALGVNDFLSKAADYNEILFGIRQMVEGCRF